MSDATGSHVAREQWTVKFVPKTVPDFAPHMERVAKIVGVSDDYAAVVACEADVQHDCGNHVSAARCVGYPMIGVLSRTIGGLVALALILMELLPFVA